MSESDVRLFEIIARMMVQIHDLEASVKRLEERADQKPEVTYSVTPPVCYVRDSEDEPEAEA